MFVLWVFSIIKFSKVDILNFSREGGELRQGFAQRWDYSGEGGRNEGTSQGLVTSK
jgi:hypothetical protein